MASSAMEKVSEKVSFAKKVLISYNYLLIIWSIHCFRVAISLVWALELGIETIGIFLINIFFYVQIPLLMKATSDDNNPTSGYMYQEITSILWTKLVEKISALWPWLFDDAICASY